MEDYKLIKVMIHKITRVEGPKFIITTHGLSRA